MLTRCRAVHSIPLVAALLVIGGLTPLSASIINPYSSFTFTGDCEDCTGQGVGYLILQNYTLGDPLDISNFVSFSYTSNLMTLILDGAGSGPGQVSDFSGSLPSQLPGFTDMSISSQSVQVFAPLSSGSWCVGINGCNLDFGVNGVFVIGVPEPASFALTFTGFAGLMLMGVRRRTRRRIRDNANG